MNYTSVILHESNSYVKAGATEYIRDYFPQIKIISYPKDVDELCDVMLATDADFILTDMLCGILPLHQSQRFIEIANSPLTEHKIIFWGARSYANYYFYENIKHKTYIMEKSIPLERLHTLFQSLCADRKMTEFELETNAMVKRLSGREFIIISKLMEGMTAKTISRALNINIKTVSTHKRNALKKLNIKSLGSLFMYK